MSDEIKKVPSPDKESLLESMFSALKESRFKEAEDFCDKILAVDPECAEAYLGKLLCDLRIVSKEELSQLEEPFDENENYIKIIHFGKEDLASEIKEHLFTVQERIYQEASEMIKDSDSEEDFYQAGCLFNEIPNYKDAAHLARKCMQESEFLHNDAIYSKAIERLRFAETLTPNDTTVQAYEASIAELKTIPDWEDAQKRIATYQARLYDIKVLMEKNREIRENKVESRKKAKRIKIAVITAIILVVAAVITAVSLYLFTPKTQTHKFNLEISRDNSESQYNELVKFRGFEPVDKILSKFVWLPSETVSTSTNAFLSTTRLYTYETSLNFVEGDIAVKFTIGEANVDSAWHNLALNAKTEISYDDNGNCIMKRTIIAEKTETVEYKYDDNGNCTEEITTDSSGKKTVKEHRYNADGTLKKSVSRDKKNKETIYDYTYGEDGMLISETITSPEGEVSTVEYEHDEFGNILRAITTDAEGNAEITEHKDYEMYYVGN